VSVIVAAGVLVGLSPAAPAAAGSPVVGSGAPEGVRPAIMTVPLVVDGSSPADAEPFAEAEGTAGPGVLAGLVDGDPTVLRGAGTVGGTAVVGVTWAEGSGDETVQVVVRTRSGDDWTPWELVENAPTEAALRGEGTRAGTEPYFVGAVDEVEAQLRSSSGATPEAATLTIIDPGASPVDTASADTPLARATDRPVVHSRADWGADESLMTWRPSEGQVTGAVVHHTAGVNGYTAGQVPGILRGIYAYHAVTRGWGDIGYNFLIDRFGRVWEGRAGGIDRPIIGAHALGANSTMFGVSIMGDYTKTTASQASMDAMADLIAWKLSIHGVMANGTGRVNGVAYPAVIGHRDVSSTSCPGSIYGSLGWLRTTATALQANYRDVFGSALGDAYLQRTLDNPTVYVVSGTTKYPIPSLALYQSLAPLGPVRYVAQSVLDRKVTGPAMRRTVLAPDGSVYFLDSGVKSHFPSCGLVSDYGFTCGDLIRLDKAALDRFPAGAAMSPVYRTSTGKVFHVDAGRKHEVADEAALVAAGLPSRSAVQGEAGLAHLPYGVPIIRDGIRLEARPASEPVLADSGRRVPLSETLRASAVLAALPVRKLDPASMAALPTTARMGVLAADSGRSSAYLLHQGGRMRLDPAVVSPAELVALSETTMGLFTDTGAFAANQFLKGADDVAVYRFADGRLHRIRAWVDLVALNRGATPSIVTVDGSTVRALPRGPDQLGPGSLVVTTASPTVYLVDGLDRLVPLRSFGPSSALGATRLYRVAPADLEGRTVTSEALTGAVQCGTQKYLGISGRLHRAAETVAREYGYQHLALDATTCAGLPVAAEPLGRFLSSATEPTIFYVQGGSKRPIRSWATYVMLGGTTANTIRADAYTLGRLPTGPLY
jgi:hypothetical protein